MYKELELGIEGVDTKAAEETVSNALKGLQGIHSARVVRGGVHVTYNPVGITPQEIIDSVRRAGFAVDTSQETGQM